MNITPKMAEAGKAKLIELGYEGVEFTDAQKVFEAMLSALTTPPAPQPALALIEELTDALQNAIGFLDTPISRRRNVGDSFYTVTVESIRTALASTKRFKGE